MRYSAFFACCILPWAAATAFGQSAACFGGGGYDGYDSGGGGAALDYPQVHNAAGATNVTDASAWLNGMLAYTGSVSAAVRVYWGKTDGGMNREGWTDSYEFGAVAELAPLAHQIAADSGSLYYYRFYATNAAGEEGWSPGSAAFHTFEAPVVSTSEGAGVSITSAVLNGALTAGVQAATWLDWGGTEEGVEPVATNVVDLGLRTEDGTLGAPNPFNVMLNTLSPATTYAYRLRAMNAYGAAASPWVWFTTRPGNYVKVWDPASFSGGWFDGYDRHTLGGSPLPGWRKGTTVTFR